jgi:predicted metal-binding membrane protein
MGLKHGGYCLGCCWALMVLLFVFGVMNLLWVACISGFVLLEKITSANQWFSRLGGLVLIVWAEWIGFGSQS